jgi:hypothetical protein
MNPRFMTKQRGKMTRSVFIEKEMYIVNELTTLKQAVENQ